MPGKKIDVSKCCCLPIFCETFMTSLPPTLFASISADFCPWLNQVVPIHRPPFCTFPAPNSYRGCLSGLGCAKDPPYAHGVNADKWIPDAIGLNCIFVAPPPAAPQFAISLLGQGGSTCFKNKSCCEGEGVYDCHIPPGGRADYAANAGQPCFGICEPETSSLNPFFLEFLFDSRNTLRSRCSCLGAIGFFYNECCPQALASGGACFDYNFRVVVTK
jgi:hypothetical protein